jgi:hypothetical protein
MRHYRCLEAEGDQDHWKRVFALSSVRINVDNNMTPVHLRGDSNRDSGKYLSREVKQHPTIWAGSRLSLTSGDPWSIELLDI